MNARRRAGADPGGRRPRAVPPRPDRVARPRSAFLIVGDAADAGEALRRARELPPDLILLDNHLPGVNGVDALPALRDAAPGARVLMLTVSEDEQDLAAALRGGRQRLPAEVHRGRRPGRGDPAGDARRVVVAPEMTGKLVAAFRDARSAGDRPATCGGRAAADRSCRRAKRTSCAASPAAPATRRSPASSASPRPRSRSTCSTCCASSTSSSRVQAAVIATEHGLN